MNLTAVVIEDEYKVREVFVELLAKFCPSIEILGQTDNITDGYQLIQSQKPSVVFLDIEMPGGSGFDLLEKFEKIPFEIIFVSSYGHYAIRAIKLSAIDYLLKPVIIEDLIAIPGRLKETIEQKQNAQKYELLKKNLIDPEQEKKIAIPTKKKLEYIPLCEIVYLKADTNYTTFVLKDDQKLLIAKTLKEYETILCTPESSFVRVHKSFIVNILHIKKLERGDDSFIIFNNDMRVEVSRRKKQELIEKMSAL